MPSGVMRRTQGLEAKVPRRSKPLMLGPAEGTGGLGLLMLEAAWQTQGMELRMARSGLSQEPPAAAQAQLPLAAPMSRKQVKSQAGCIMGGTI